MHKVLVLFAHPRFEKSKVNKALVNAIPKHVNITFHDLYERYPNFNIDVAYEKKLLAEHSIIIWHHPFFWYSCPPLLKQWIDLVLEFGWAYGPGGDALKDKYIFNAITSGGPRAVYAKEGHHRFTIQEFLAPFDQTARLCKMNYLPPFAVQGTHRITPEELNEKVKCYNALLTMLVEGNFQEDELKKHPFLDEWMIENINKRAHGK